MPKIKNETSVRHCYGNSPQTLEITGETQADQFIALGKWLRDNDDAHCFAVKPYFDGEDVLIAVVDVNAADIVETTSTYGV